MAQEIQLSQDDLNTISSTLGKWNTLTEDQRTTALKGISSVLSGVNVKTLVAAFPVELCSQLPKELVDFRNSLLSNISAITQSRMMEISEENLRVSQENKSISERILETTESTKNTLEGLKQIAEQSHATLEGIRIGQEHNIALSMKVLIENFLNYEVEVQGTNFIGMTVTKRLPRRETMSEQQMFHFLGLCKEGLNPENAYAMIQQSINVQDTLMKANQQLLSAKNSSSEAETLKDDFMASIKEMNQSQTDGQSNNFLLKHSGSSDTDSSDT